MSARRFLQLDVFADRPGAGNPLAVAVDAQDLDEAAMQAFAAWTNLSETIFLLPPTTPEADYRVRIFTPNQEYPFAGHPSVGAAWAVLDQGLARARDGVLVQECAAGLLPVRVDDYGSVSVRAPRPRELFDARGYEALLNAACGGLARGALPPAAWDGGPLWWMVELADADAVRGATPDMAAISALSRATDTGGLAVFARVDGDDHQLVLRAFCPGDGMDEDPVTGSANACAAAALAAAGRLPGRDGRYVASQGREIGRDGRVSVRVDADGGIWIGGQVQPVIRGQLAW
ncbi:PhzF family phenazine biosynthesis protein [Montanilutibacter psychrotolerans]|uniref:PhzF family phenazine biosynthesis protein n=1 Tax=Montanilutibacter psychrotolerans TaxID=1327343 RepID=A0A3M8SXK3_9GAMM|nr:PhzF family phenazine biosynthesis protein [Lysobacter psychrotolerans]RNF86108.1 PhzF family phenazine biosynthesis protein [Lysobacter psychrotolerans]